LARHPELVSGSAGDLLHAISISLFFTLKGLYDNSPRQRLGENAFAFEMAQSSGVEWCERFMRHNGKCF